MAKLLPEHLQHPETNLQLARGVALKEEEVMHQIHQIHQIHRQNH
jgi:hypothetical protein